jgi:hypothetical protein
VPKDPLVRWLIGLLVFISVGAPLVVAFVLVLR